MIALVATLAAMAALGRVAFAATPNVKPTTDIVLIAGYSLGGAPGFMVGAVAALASNLFFGQGPWTPWQMVGWGGVGLFGAALASSPAATSAGSRSPRRAGSPALGFGAVMNLHMWVTTPATHRGQLIAYFATSLPFDLAHAVGQHRLLPAVRPGARARAPALPDPLRDRLAASPRTHPGVCPVG